MKRTTFVIGVAFLITGAVRPIAQQATGSPSQPAAVGRTTTASPKVQAGGHASLSQTIRGTALNPAGRALANAAVRLRDARTGHVADSQVTDRDGLFMFDRIEPGSYVVEVVGADQTTVLAASEIININAGEVATTFVKLPLNTLPLGGVLGSTTSSAAVIAAEAAAAGILATTVVGTAASDRPIR